MGFVASPRDSPVRVPSLNSLEETEPVPVSPFAEMWPEVGDDNDGRSSDDEST